MKLSDTLNKYSGNEAYYNTELNTGWYHLSNAKLIIFPLASVLFSGQCTGTGGRIRDTISIGQGGIVLSGFCGYYVGSP